MSTSLSEGMVCAKRRSLCEIPGMQFQYPSSLVTSGTRLCSRKEEPCRSRQEEVLEIGDCGRGQLAGFLRAADRGVRSETYCETGLRTF